MMLSRKLLIGSVFYLISFSLTPTTAGPKRKSNRLTNEDANSSPPNENTDKQKTPKANDKSKNPVLNGIKSLSGIPGTVKNGLGSKIMDVPFLRSIINWGLTLLEWIFRFGDSVLKTIAEIVEIFNENKNKITEKLGPKNSKNGKTDSKTDSKSKGKENPGRSEKGQEMKEDSDGNEGNTEEDNGEDGDESGSESEEEDQNSPENDKSKKKNGGQQRAR